MTKLTSSLLIGLLMITPVLPVFSGLALAPLLALFLLLLFITHAEAAKQLVPLSHSTISLVMSGLLLLALISCSWAPNSVAALTLWGKLVFLLMGTIIAMRLLALYPLPVPAMLLPAALVCALALALEERFSEGFLALALQHRLLGNMSYAYAMTDLNRAATVLSVVLWPALLPLIRTKRTGSAVLLVLATFGVVLSLQSLSAVMGVAAGGLVFLLVVKWQGTAIKGLLIATIAGIAAIPFLMLLQNPDAIVKLFPSLPESAQHRLYIWDFAANKALLHPWLGWGFNTSRVIPILPSDMLSGGKSPLPLHPHNGILQLWLELGIPGVLLCAAWMVALFNHIRTQSADRAHMAIATASLMAYFVVGLTAYGIWQEWWLATACLTGFWLRLVEKPTGAPIA